jgi:hypothetical protein
VKPVAAMVAITVLVLTGLTGLLFAPPLAGTAHAQPAPVVTTVPGGPLRLELTDMTPRVVTADGPSTLTLTGTVTNTGADPVDQLVVRVQRGDPLTTDGQLRDALDGSAGADAVTPQFVPLTDVLGPGQQVPVNLSVPLRGAPEVGLALGRTGVHELLVNVNGVPRDGDRARLAAQRMLLPVLSLPPAPGAPSVPADDESADAPFSLLYPIADVPHRLPTVPIAPVLLDDDSLATSFAPGGRLYGLVSALAAEAPPGSPVRNATCLAVDPDLVETAGLMSASAGYQVATPDGPPTPGTGADAARQWLAQLATVARGGCVIALPYADADLVALTRGGQRDLATAAITDGRQVLSNLLGTPVVPDVTWPADGVIDEPTLDTTARAGGRSLLLSADGVEQGRTRPNAGVVPIAGGPTVQSAVLTDPLLTLAADGPSAPSTSAIGPGGAAATGTASGTDTPLATQDVIGALAFRALGTPATDGPLVLAPPHRWATDGTGAQALLAAAGRLLAGGELAPRNLASVLAVGPPTGAKARQAVYPLTAGGREIPGSVVDTIRTTSQALIDLRSAVVPNSGVGIGVDEMFGLLTRGLVRPASATWRGQPAVSTDAADAAAAGIGDLRATIRVLEPPSPYSLGTSDAPLPLTVANGLPVTVQVRVQIAATPGLRVAPIAPVQIPPLGRRQVSVNAQVTRSGQFTVDAKVLTPDGGSLGPASRLKVRSTAYGTITVWLTVGAGVLLVVLAVRRVLRRVHGEPGRHMGRNARTDPTPPPSPAPLPASPEGLSTGTDPPQAPRGPYPRQEPVGQDLRPPAPMPGDHRTPATTPAVPAPEDIVATDRFPPRRPRQEPPRTPSPRP